MFFLEIFTSVFFCYIVCSRYIFFVIAILFYSLFFTQTGSKDEEVSSVIKFNVLFVFFVALMFALSIFFLFFYHIYLTLTNQSTIESFHPPYFPHGPDRRGYRLSYKENWKQVFGPDPKHWFLPTFSRFVFVVVVVFLLMLTPCLLFFLCLAPSMD